jgi:hypothetical protein
MTLVDEAETLLLHQFKDAVRLKGLVRSLVAPLMQIAADINKLADGIFIDNATTNLLDVIGRLVGQPRANLSDEDMRSWLRLRIALNHCNGSPEELLSLLRILLGEDVSLKLSELKPYDAVLVFFDKFSLAPEAIFAVIKSASPLGLQHHFIDASSETPFQLDTSAFSSSQFAEFFP